MLRTPLGGCAIEDQLRGESAVLRTSLGESSVEDQLRGRVQC